MSLHITTFFLLLLFLFNGISANSQQPDFAFKNININDGLSQNSVVDIAEDELGFMWFATQLGLNRFDGRNFISFPKAFDDITSPQNAQIGKITPVGHELWLLSSGGKLEVLDLYTQKFRPLEVVSQQEKELPPVSYLLHDSRKNLWIGTLEHGLYFLNTEQDSLRIYHSGAASSHQILSNRVCSVFEDSQKNIWVLTDKGISMMGETLDAVFLKNINTNVLTEDPGKNLWVGTFGKGVFVKGSDQEYFEPFSGFPDYSLPKDLVVEAIYADQDGRIWVGTYGDGLYIINPATATISHQLPDKRNPFSLGFNYVLSIKPDSKEGYGLVQTVVALAIITAIFITFI